MRTFKKKFFLTQLRGGAGKERKGGRKILKRFDFNQQKNWIYRNVSDY
jgi:hypothetical protein